MDDLLTSREVAKLLGIPRATLNWYRWKGARLGPPYVKIEGHVRYMRSDVEGYIAARRVASTGRRNAENEVGK